MTGIGNLALRDCPPAHATAPREAAMNKQAVYHALEEFLTVFFLAAGPALGAAIVPARLRGLVPGLLAFLRR